MDAKPAPQHFNFCPSCGSAEVTLEEGKRVYCPSCEFTLYFSPTCSAGALIFDKAGRLLVIERARDPSKGKYGVPGGFTDKGERLEEVVARETKEEVNLDITSAKFFASFPNVYEFRGVAYNVTDTYFLASVDSFEGFSAEESEVAGTEFVNPAEVPDEKWAFKSLRLAIGKYLERS